MKLALRTRKLKNATDKTDKTERSFTSITVFRYKRVFVVSCTSSSVSENYYDGDDD